MNFFNQISKRVFCIINKNNCLYIIIILAYIIASNNVFSCSLLVDEVEKEEGLRSCNDDIRDNVLLHYTNADIENKSSNDILIIDSVTVEPMPEWKVHYGPTLNGKIGNTTTGIRITVTRLNGHAQLQFTPIVEVRVDKKMTFSYQMSVAAHEGEYQHFIDMYLCWKNVFTPFVTELVGKKQNISELKQKATTYFVEHMNRTRRFWDDSGRHNINYFGFRHAPTQAEIDEYRMDAFGDIYPYNYNSGMLADTDEESVSSKTES